MATQVQLYSPIGGPIQTANSGTVYPNSQGIITVSSADVGDLVKAGCVNINLNHNFYTPGSAPAAASAGLFFASAALSNGTLAIAAQADVPRPATAIINPGTLAITAGTLALTYSANDGTTAQVDSFPLNTAVSTNLTLQTTKGVEIMSSMVVAGLSGGATPGVQIGTTLALALPVAPQPFALALTKEVHTGANATLGTLVGTNGIVNPSTAPNGTITYGFGYNYGSPNS